MLHMTVSAVTMVEERVGVLHPHLCSSIESVIPHLGQPDLDTQNQIREIDRQTEAKPASPEDTELV